MNLRQIEVFQAVMSTGSVSGAAQLLHVSGPAISRMLSHTEQSLGYPLFERTKGRLYPTDEARRLYRDVQQTYAGIRRIGSLAQELAQRRLGLLGIASSPSIGHELVPLAIAALRGRHPKLHVRFMCLHHDLLKSQLLEGQVDMGISTLPMDHPQLAMQPVARSELVCICPWDHPLATAEAVTVADFQQYPPIGYLPETPMARRLETLFAPVGGTPAAAIQVGSPQNACALVQSGAGLALVDQFSLQSWPKAQFRTLPVDGAPPILAHLVYLRGSPLSPMAKSFVACLDALLQERGLGVNGTYASVLPTLSMSLKP
jgi:DNA-binding transcriptional LysR family regulator